MTREHERAVRLAHRTSQELKRLFDKAGSAEHPRGQIVAAYSTARRAVRSGFNDQAAVADAMSTLRLSVAGGSLDLFDLAVALGLEQAERELRLYGIPAAGATMQLERAAALNAVTAVVDDQGKRVNALALTGIPGAAALALALLRPSPAQAELARWVTLLQAGAWSKSAGNAGIEFRRQAIAAVDERTTNTCLRVHGQVVRMDEPFRLTDEPRYAGEIMSPPFHDYCRTATALVRAEDADDATTRKMVEASRSELRERETAGRHIADLQEQLAGLGAAPDVRVRADDTMQVARLRIRLRMWRQRARVPIHPVSATSRRQ